MKDKEKKNKKAVAIKYDIDEIAPQVIAQGKGYVADKIIKTGEESKIPVVEDETLVEDLMNINLGDYIPPDLYTAVAQILIFITDLDKYGK